MSEGRVPVHPPRLGDVPRERGPPPRHVQLQLQLPRLLQRQPAVQVRSLQSLPISL